MNPLDRDRLRRRRVAARMCLLIGPLLVATAGIVAPAIERHRDSSTRHAESLTRFDEQIRAIADLIEFKRSHASALSHAEAELDGLMGSGALPIDFRARVRAALEAVGATVLEIDPIEDEEPRDGNEGEDGDEIASPFSWARAVVETTVAFDDVPATLSVLTASGPCVVIEQVHARRDADRFGFVSLRCELAYLMRLATMEGE